MNAVAGALALAVDALYVGILLSEGQGDLGEPISIAFATALGLAALALLVPARPRLWAAAAAVLAACAVVSGFSIGLLLVPSVVLALLAAAHA